MEWIPERVFQKYVRDNPEHFRHIFDGKVPRIEFNQIIDKYPDLVFILYNKIRIPVEVEWKTSNFLAHKHDPNILSKGIGYDRPGFLLVEKKEEHARIGNIKQYKIDLKKFEKWFTKNAKSLVLKTTEEIHIEDRKREPKLWICYLPVKGNAFEHFTAGLKHQIWEYQKNFLIILKLKKSKRKI